MGTDTPSRPGPHSYIVRVWVEDEDDRTDATRLRGSISYVAMDGSPTERSFTDLDVIPRFIQAHLRSIGLIRGRRRTSRSWLARFQGGRKPR
jgi:hypothetical protein